MIGTNIDHYTVNSSVFSLFALPLQLSISLSEGKSRYVLRIDCNVAGRLNLAPSALGAVYMHERVLKVGKVV